MHFVNPALVQRMAAAGRCPHGQNVLQFIEFTLHHLGDKEVVGLFRTDSGFYDAAILRLLEEKKIDYIISAKFTQALQRAILRDARWWALETGLELAESSIRRKAGRIPGASWWYVSRSNARTRRARRFPCLPTTQTFRGGGTGRW